MRLTPRVAWIVPGVRGANPRGVIEGLVNADDEGEDETSTADCRVDMIPEDDGTAGSQSDEGAVDTCAVDGGRIGDGGGGIHAEYVACCTGEG